MLRSRLAAAAALTLFAAPPQVHDSRVELVRLADGVYAAIRREPLGLAVNSNSLIVVGEREVLVVDAQFTREATQETIGAIRSVTPHPVRWVVNTHWHDDHVAGNQVYRDSFPGVQFVLHQNTREDLARLGEPNRTATGQGAPPLVERYDRLLGQGLGVDSTPVSGNERASLTSALRIMRRYLAELPDFRFTAEGPTVREALRLEVGTQVVDIRWFGRANTRGDLVVLLPRHGIVATGDLVVWPIPFGFLSYPREWTEVLDSVSALAPRQVVPGHGPVMGDLGYLRRVRSLLAEAADSAAASIARGDSLAVALRTIQLAEPRQEMTGGEKWLTYMWNQFFLRPVVTSVFRQLEAPPDPDKPRA